MTTDTRPLAVGDRIKDNDPRMGDRVLTVTHVTDTHVNAMDSIFTTRAYLRRRIYTDSKPRRSGFSRIEP